MNSFQNSNLKKFFEIEVDTKFEPLDEGIASSEPFSDAVYERLPESLHKLTKNYNEGYERDLVLLAAITAISPHLVNIKIPHSKADFYPTFKSLVIAPPASGKGSAAKMRGLADELDAHFRKQFGRKASLKLPANSSYRALIDTLLANREKGLIFETEIDQMLHALKQSWGNFSVLIRQSFSHEEVEIARKDELIKIKNPRLSNYMTGTIDQFQNMFHGGSGNGFISRYALYAFQDYNEYRSQRPTKGSRRLNQHIEDYSQRLLDAYLMLVEYNTPIYVELRDDQWDKVDQMAEKMEQYIKDENIPKFLIQNARRMFKVALRIATIATFMRRLERNEISVVISKQALEISDADLELAVSMCQTFMDHTIRLFDYLPIQNPSHLGLGKRFDDFVDQLPKSFERGKAIDIGESLGIPEPTLDKWLKKMWDEGMLEKVRMGCYRKLN